MVNAEALGAVLAEDQLVAELEDADTPKPDNDIHSTEGARARGFRAALVGGATVYGWSVRTIVRALGEGWLAHGWAHVRFRRPVYPQDPLTMRVYASGALRIDTAEGCSVEGEVGIGDAPWLGELQQPSNVVACSPEQPLPMLTPESAPVGADLAARAVRLDVPSAVAFARDVEREVDARFIGPQPLAHPGWLAMQPIHLLHHSYRYGPAIHVSSHIQHLARASADASWLVAGRCVEAYERKGHQYLVNDCVLRDRGRDLDVARIRHTVIYRVAARA